MAFVGRSDLPVYILADPPRRKRRMLLSPAVRWRVIVEQISEIEHDVVLETVLRIRAAGEVSPTRIADLLQLPEDLVRHLLAQAATGGLNITQDGQLQTSASKVAWVYRDMATGELWPDSADEVPPLATRFTSRHRAQFNRGTPGRPDIVECLLLDTPETTVAKPTSIELARFSRASNDPNRRTAIVSSGEECLVASPIVGLTAGCAVQTTRGIPHLSLSQHLARAAQQDASVSRWLAAVPRETVPHGTEVPLRRALSELRDIVGDWTKAGETFETDATLSRVDFCLSRFVDQFRYLYGIEADADPGPGSAAVLGVRFGLTEDDAALLANSERGTIGRKVTRLLLAAFDMDSPALKGLTAATVQFTALAQTTSPLPVLTTLVEAVIALCDRLMASLEGADVQQAE
jgi:hypothetical protein